jgi:hypothetical protein
MMTHFLKLFCLVGLLLLALSPPAHAETSSRPRTAAVACAAGDGNAPAPVLLAQGLGIGRFFSGAGGRTRVVQFCVVTMCIALFIMMRKLN